MTLHVYCVVSGGIPILYRSSGRGKTLSFSELAPLNGIQVFGKIHSVTFKSTEGKDFEIHWKNFNEKLSLILISRHSVHGCGELVLDSVFDAMVLTVGIDKLKDVKNIDRLKKELKPSYSLIDGILHSVDEFSENSSCNVGLLSMTPIIPSMNCTVLQEKLDEWSEIICSLFCCLIVDSKLVIASSGWWELAAVERSLLLSKVTMNRTYTTIDIPVFLPIKSPKTAFRLVATHLMANIWVVALCGPTPSVVEFERNSTYCWNSTIDILSVLPTSFTLPVIPDYVNTQHGMLGSLMINYMIGNYILLGSVTEDSYHFDILRIFYYKNVKQLLDDDDDCDIHKIRDTYWYSENYKLYASINKPWVVCLIASSVVPIPSIRSILKDILAVIMKNKLLC